jgi:predicted HTH transcriptional regulator
MSLLHIPFDDLRGSDLEGLITNAVREGRYLDYKEQQIGRRREDTKEFLSDVVSFANADGGDLILGVREQRDADNKPTGIPAQLVGLAGVNLDEEINRLENLIRTGTARRLIGVCMRPVGDPPCLVNSRSA